MSNVMFHLDMQLPRDKFDTENARALVTRGYPAVEPVLPALLEWVQDLNWPVAQVLQPFLADIGRPLAPHVRYVLESDDAIWKYWVLHCIVAESTELAEELRPELTRLADAPSSTEDNEEVKEAASEILTNLKRGKYV